MEIKQALILGGCPPSFLQNRKSSGWFFDTGLNDVKKLDDWATHASPLPSRGPRQLVAGAASYVTVDMGGPDNSLSGRRRRKRPRPGIETAGWPGHRPGPPPGGQETHSNPPSFPGSVWGKSLIIGRKNYLPP